MPRVHPVRKQHNWQYGLLSLPVGLWRIKRHILRNSLKVFLDTHRTNRDGLWGWWEKWTIKTNISVECVLCSTSPCHPTIYAGQNVSIELSAVLPDGNDNNGNVRRWPMNAFRGNNNVSGVGNTIHYNLMIRDVSPDLPSFHKSAICFLSLDIFSRSIWTEQLLFVIITFNTPWELSVRSVLNCLTWLSWKWFGNSTNSTIKSLYSPCNPWLPPGLGDSTIVHDDVS
jgi:hypothetical protein